ncbi:hypothetical protein R1flu_001464 [Riccia fluitans]|uniref:Uncharacterized protein n=1 Tax=Riccia fluitans TaxID=41844 RepID=A0ABD1Y7C7_9MARC
MLGSIPRHNGRSARFRTEFWWARSFPCRGQLPSRQRVLTLHLLNEAAKGQASSWFLTLSACLEFITLCPTLQRQKFEHFRYVDEARWAAEKAAWHLLASSQSIRAWMDWEDAKSFMEEINLRRRFRSYWAWLWASGTVKHVLNRKSPDLTAPFNEDQITGVPSSAEADSEGESSHTDRNDRAGLEDVTESKLNSMMTSAGAE